MAKIVHLTSVATPLHVRIFAKQCRSLAASGNEVVLLCAKPTEGDFDGVKIRSVGVPSGRIHRMTVIVARMLRMALKEKADLYVTHDPELTPVAWALSALGKSVVCDMHENSPKQVLHKAYLPSYLRKAISGALALTQRALLPRLPVVFAESSYAKHYRYVQQSETVLNMPPLGTVVERFDQPTLGYIGGVSELRGACTTLEALRLLAERDCRPQFQCLGPIDSDCERELHQQAEHLPGQVRLPGYVPSDEGWQIIARCHVGIAVLKNIPNYYESFPGKMFEYMSFGVPVIVSDFPLYREIVDRVGCGRCVDPDSPQQIADAIHWMMQHPAEAQAMGQRGREAVQERYNWQVEYAKLLDFYDQVLKPRGLRVQRKPQSSAMLAA